jgi:hypothetical protein
MNRSICAIFSCLVMLTSLNSAALAQRGYGGMGGMSPSGPQSGKPGGYSGMSSGPSDETVAERPAGEVLQQNPRLSATLTKLLPAGTDLQVASAGFRNLGEFAAAVHASHNLAISFADLKAKIVAGANLGQAIRTLKPETDAEIEVRKARAQVEEDVEGG